MGKNRKLFVRAEDTKLGTKVKFDKVICITKENWGFLKTVINTDCSLLTFSNVMCHEELKIHLNRESLIELRDIINIVLEQSKPTIKIN